MCSSATSYSPGLGSVTAEAEEMEGNCGSVIPAGIPYTVAKLGSELYVRSRAGRERLSFRYAIKNRVS